MKIWYVCKYADSTASDNIKYGRFLGLSKSIANKGHDITLIYSRSNGSKQSKVKGFAKSFVIEGVKCVIINGPLISLGFNVKRIISWLLFEILFFRYAVCRNKRERPEVIIASSLSLLTFVTAAILKKIFKCKLVLEIRDIYPDTIICMGKFSRNNLFIKFLRVIERIGYRNADGFISTLPRFDDYLQKRISRPFKCTCITQGFDMEAVKWEENNE